MMTNAKMLAERRMCDLGYVNTVPLNRRVIVELDKKAEVDYWRERRAELVDEVAELQARLEKEGK